MRNDACHDNRERDVTFGTKHFHYTTEALYEMNGVREGSHFRLRIILRSHIEFKDWKVFRFLILCPILKRQECVLILHRTKEKKIKAKKQPSETSRKSFAFARCEWIFSMLTVRFRQPRRNQHRSKWALYAFIAIAIPR